MSGATHPVHGGPTVRRRCPRRCPSRSARWWDRDWDAPAFERLVGRGVLASIATGAGCGALAGLTLGALAPWVAGAGLLVFAILAAIVGAFSGGAAGLVVAPVVAAALIATRGTRRRALAAGATAAVGATTLVLLGILATLPGGLRINAGTVSFLALADVGAYLATRSVVIHAVTAPARA